MVNKFTAVSDYDAPDENEDVDTKHRYDRVLSVVDHQSSPKQRPGVRPRVVYQTLACYAVYTRSGLKASIQAALDNGDLLAFRDPDGNLRLVLLTESKLRRLVEHYPEVADRPRIAEVLDDS
ncbi:hypothetical protein [Haloarcula amylovorans]|uniref:hypothetical protein n=1 Tax=Haloarcula amylovorans TaxID=2562280 RepID=UPI0010767687|nr:hypothetical protein [Halomicroarcula amylolytica]